MNEDVQPERPTHPIELEGMIDAFNTINLSDFEYDADKRSIVESILEAYVKVNQPPPRVEEIIARIEAKTNQELAELNTASARAIAKIEAAATIKASQAQHGWRSSIVWAVALVAVVLIIMTNLPK